ncbi:hypothetical protein ACLVWU_10080 [Bdellovibrio sp. HCB290]|uniref:hypothetical protein n=1 Tax=Bdellovibrio sp. HCB290 TaxID=3394356 RepID=UPI0039B43C4E
MNANMIVILGLLFAFLNVARAADISSIPKNKTSLLLTNYGSAFKAFINKSGKLDDSSAWIQWREVVEKTNPSLYQQLIGGSKNNNDWVAAYEKRFKKAFPSLKKYSPEIIAEFDQFESKLQKHIDSFGVLFPDFDFSDVSVYAMPSLLMFNGQGPDFNGKLVLTFGIDTIVIKKHDPQSVSNESVLYPHEIFHIYHGKKLGLTEEKFMASGTLLHSAWLEGLATHVTGVMNPQASLSDLLMDAKLGDYCEAHGESLFQKYSPLANKKISSKETQKIYGEWFLVGGQKGDTPARAGYCVGLLLARRASQKYSLNEMVNWSFEDISLKIAPFLKL